DEAYRQTLNEDLLTALPANPAGEMELSDECLNAIYGGVNSTGGLIHHLIVVISNVQVFSVNILASPLNQTCAANRS
ncbi:MAG TPA: mersacidin/lichenicidin family type 2 lantibiotic, partial [Ktedonobacteraceae bacterium]|nr:mersacidin/lichenicidin family type 2 lantibiotic [Ktedonobacteraceae bacterium]